MIKLFEFKDYQVSISEEALLLKPFAKLWTRDRSYNKSIALAELGYVYFMCDPRSDYMAVIDEAERSRDIIAAEGLPEGWSPDDKVKEAMKFYLSFRTSSARILDTTRKALDKIREYLADIDLHELDDKGRPVYQVNTIASTIKIIPSLLKDLNEIERMVRSEESAVGRSKGTLEKSIFDDGF